MDWKPHLCFYNLLLVSVEMLDQQLFLVKSINYFYLVPGRVSTQT